MTTPTLGVDCHLVLTHASVDAGTPYGFLCPNDGTIKEEGVQVIRQVITDDMGYSDPHSGTQLWVSFDILCADNLRTPDGRPHPKTRAQDYAKIMEFLLQTEGIILETPIGSFINLGALGFSADERHRPHHSIIRCELNNVGSYFPPIDPALLAESIWDGPLTWSTAYWR